MTGDTFFSFQFLLKKESFSPFFLLNPLTSQNRATKFVTQNPNPISSATVAEVWEKYDAEKTGVISEDQARAFLADLASRENVTLEDEALLAMIEECSDDSDKFTFDAFKKLVAEWAAANEVDLSVSMQAELDSSVDEALVCFLFFVYYYFFFFNVDYFYYYYLFFLSHIPFLVLLFIIII